MRYVGPCTRVFRFIEILHKNASMILESYLLDLSPYERDVLTKFRCCNLNLPTETGDGKIFQEKIDYVSYVIYKILEMNIII